MSSRSLTFDLPLSNRIYKANINSLIVLSNETIVSNAKQNIDNFITSYETPDDKSDLKNELFERASHLANIDWLFLNSIFISIFSYFEYHLLALAKVIEERNNSQIKVENIHGNGILQYLNYINLVGEITIVNQKTEDWQVIEKFRKVRNILAHKGGIMIWDLSKTLQSHELYEFLHSQEVIMAGSIGHIRLRTTTILNTFAELTSKISDSLLSAIEERFPYKFQ